MKKRCEKCGAELHEDSVFCGMCGARVEEESELEEKAVSEEEQSVSTEEVVSGQEVYLFHPIKTARRLAEKYTIENQGKRKNFLRFFLVLFEVVLLCGNIASCGDTTYTGRDLIQQTLRVSFSGWNQWGKAVVPLLFLIYGYVLVRTFMVKEREFQRYIKPIWNVNLLMLVTVVFYAATDYFDLKSGSFVCLAIGIAVDGLMLYGTAYEIQNGLEPVPGKVHDWFIPKNVMAGLAFLGVIFCAIMYMQCGDKDLKMLFWLPVAIKIFSAGISCWKKEKSYQMMRLQSCVDLLCCAVLFLFYKTYSHSTKYILDSGLMLAMAVISPFGLNYLWERRGKEMKITDTHKKVFRIVILLVASASAVFFIFTKREAREKQIRSELARDINSSYGEGIWDLEGINGNFVIYTPYYSDIQCFQCGIDGELKTGVLHSSGGRLLSLETLFEIQIKEKLDGESYLVDITYSASGGERENRQNVKMTRINPEEVSLYIAQSISEQAKWDLGGDYVPMGGSMWCGGEERLLDNIDWYSDLKKMLGENEGTLKGCSSLQYVRDGAMLWVPPIYASYEINPAQEFRCVSSYSDTKYGY